MALTGLMLLGISSSFAQIQFQQAPAPPPAPQISAEFAKSSNSSIESGDVNGDGHPDVVIMGTTQGITRTDLYINDGSGGYVRDQMAGFVAQFDSDIRFIDADGDGDLDLIVPNVSGTIIYANDGLGHFTAGQFGNLAGLKWVSVAVADVNGDGHDDIFISGANVSNVNEAYLYINDGQGGFVAQAETPFVPFSSGSAVFADIDGDGTIDLLTLGSTSQGPLTKIYFNDGNGNFTAETVNSLPPLDMGDIAVMDVDGDGSMDVLVAGRNQFNAPQTGLYLNYTANGNWAIQGNLGLANVRSCVLTFADVDNDANPELLVSGFNSASQRVSILYTYAGDYSFSEIDNTTFIPISSGDHDFFDATGDGNLDLIVAGSRGFDDTRMYINEGAGSFNEVINTPFAGFEFSALDLADVTGNGYPDVLMTGTSSVSPIFPSQLYKNIGGGQYEPAPDTPFLSLRLGTVRFADIDGDGDQDVLVAGQTVSSGIATKLYTNDGAGNFTEVLDTPFDNVMQSDAVFADLNGNGALDLILTGYVSNNNFIAKMYFNDGDGNFTLQPGTPFTGVEYGTVTCADIDNDGDLDVFITGQSNNMGRIARLYKNDGAGNFTLVPQSIFTFPANGVSRGAVIIEDLDGDGLKEILMTGQDQSLFRIVRLYKQDAEGNFSIQTNLPFPGVFRGSLAAADVDGDGDLDVLLTGLATGNVRLAQLFENDGEGNFSLVENMPFEGVENSAIAFSDVDLDGKPDIIITGLGTSNLRTGKLFRNLTPSECSISAICQSAVLVLDANGNASLDPSQVDDGSEASCGTATLALSQTAFTAEDLGENTITLTVTDAQGNTATCEATVVVVAAETLTLQCPDDTEQSCAESLLPEFTGTAIAESPCGMASLLYTDATSYDSCSATISRTWTATDLCGNTLSCEQLITQLYTDAPEIMMPAQSSTGLTCSVLQPDDVLAFLNGELSEPEAEAFALSLHDLFDTYGLVPAGATSACSEAEVLALGFTAPDADYSCPVRAVVQANWMAVDACGNQSDILSTSIVISDFSTPVIFGAPDVIISCDTPLSPDFTGYSFASDNCEPDVSLTYSDAPLGSDCGSSFIRLWSAVDQCGNTATYEQLITLVEEPASCASPPVGLQASALSQGTVQLSWNPVAGTVACRVFGRLAGSSSSVVAGTVTGNEPASLTVSHPLLQNGQQIEWRVVCACSTEPLVITPFSAWSNFSFFTGQSIAAQSPPAAEPMTVALKLWPNPTEGIATVAFTPAAGSRATLELLDLNGRRLQKLFDAHTEPGTEHTLKIDSSHLPNGVYLCRLSTGHEVEVRRLVIAR